MSLDEIEEPPSPTPVIPQIRSTESPGFAAAGLPTEPAGTGALTVESIVRLLTLVRADLAAELDHDATPEELLDQVVQVATRLVPGADDAGVALVSDLGLQTVAAAGDAAVAADDIQRALGDGPSQQVITDGQTLRIADLLAESRWARCRCPASGPAC